MAKHRRHCRSFIFELGPFGWPQTLHKCASSIWRPTPWPINREPYKYRASWHATAARHASSSSTASSPTKIDGNRRDAMSTSPNLCTSSSNCSSTNESNEPNTTCSPRQAALATASKCCSARATARDATDPTPTGLAHVVRHQTTFPEDVQAPLKLVDVSRFHPVQGIITII